MSGARTSDVMFRRFLERISDQALFVLDRSGAVVSWNDGARAIIGHAPDEIIGHPASTFYTPEERRSGLPDAALATALANGRYEVEGWRVRKDGNRFWAAITVATIADDAGVVTGFGVTIRDLSERLKAEEQKAAIIASLEQSAGTDFLTGIANRRALDIAMTTGMATAKRHGRPFSVAMLDLDHFKHFNDTRGHTAGDDYLRRVIGCWRDVIRIDSVLARYGGEEFTILMPDTIGARAVQAMQRVRLATPAPITCSIGIAQWDMGESAEALLDRADKGLYAAKGGGRDRVEYGPASVAARRIGMAGGPRHTA